jgi:hypothetical protein
LLPNNGLKISIYFVDFYRRMDYGNPRTSLLLKALQLVSRFRFLFLEEESEFHYVNIQLVNVDQLLELARRVVGELDLLTSDMHVANLQLPGTWGQFVPVEMIVEMSAVWGPLDADLRRIYDEISSIGRPAGLAADGGAASKQRVALSKARAEMGEKLKEIREKTIGHNAALLKSMAEKLTELAAITPSTTSVSGAPASAIDGVAAASNKVV